MSKVSLAAVIEMFAQGAVHVGHAVDPAAVGASVWPEFGFSDMVRHATGLFGLLVVFVYSFLIAFALPGVSEVVLLAPIELGLTYWQRMAVIIFVSGVGKAAGSVFAFHIGQEAKEAGPIVRALRRSRFDVVEWSEKRTVELAQKWGYAGLAAALCVPGFPDTLSIYAFSVLEEDYLKFAVATFVGSVGRLVITLVGVEAVLAVGWV
ncbi:membrane protein YqaA, SNARE-associated domain [Halopelagius longus]|uniref:Membrane protein YqaA, SNARE-associated domain n=2 Tax=Halopelagius longus TaxID=1236180 RepID=A0A1H1D4U9_9EURY|nr:membrane protein YqaA, SNARE-associated domain [Halopelagius longus]